jgi:hypothetical protein
MDFNINAEVRSALERWKEADPHVIAKRLVARVPEEDLRAVLADVLGDRVRIVIGQKRMRTSGLGERLAPPSAGLQRGASRWQVWSGDLTQRYCVDGVWKLLGECSADDCDSLAVDYARRAAEQSALEDKFRRLSARLRASGAATVADLGDQLEAAA